MTRLEKKIVELAKRFVHNCDPFNKSLHVSLLMRGDFLIVYGVNQESCNDQHAMGWQNNSIHAEYNVVKRFRKKFSINRLSECELWSIRLTRKNEIRNAKPCKRCKKHLEKFAPHKIYYSTDEGIFKEV